MIGDKPIKPCHYMRLRHMDVVALSHARPTVPHKAGEGELVHSALGTPGAEGVTPAVKLESLQSRLVDGLLVACCTVVKWPDSPGPGKTRYRDPFTNFRLASSISRVRGVKGYSGSHISLALDRRVESPVARPVGLLGERLTIPRGIVLSSAACLSPPIIAASRTVWEAAAKFSDSSAK